MNRFEEPVCEVVLFGDTDVIATSIPSEDLPNETHPRITTPEISIL